MPTAGHPVTSDSKRARVLVLCDHDIGGAGGNALGLRCLQFLTSLARDCDVAIGQNGAVCRATSTGFKLECYRSKSELKRLLADYDLLVCEAIPFELLQTIASSRIRVVLDAYAPSFELLERFPGLSPRLMELMYRRIIVWLKTVIWAVDLVISPNEKEADFLLGVMHAMGKLDARLHAADPTIRSLVRVVPFGMRNEVPQHRRRVLKGVLPGIGNNDFVLLWNSGIYGWLDATTLVRAMRIVL